MTAPVISKSSERQESDDETEMLVMHESLINGDTETIRAAPFPTQLDAKESAFHSDADKTFEYIGYHNFKEPQNTDICTPGAYRGVNDPEMVLKDQGSQFVDYHDLKESEIEDLTKLEADKAYIF